MQNNKKYNALNYCIDYCVKNRRKWIAVGLFAGIIIGVVLVANRSGVIESTQAAQFTNAKIVLLDLRNVYAPSILTYKGVKSMWMGGWLTNRDVGADKIYSSEFKRGSWTKPRVSFKKDGYHINDPSVIKHPQQDWLFMYYTALSNDDAAANRLNRNVVGFASSVNGGKSWTDHGIVISQNNGINSSGAWAPSAFVKGNEIWVYYHTNNTPEVFRTRFNLTGWQKIGATERVNFVKKGKVCAPGVSAFTCSMCKSFGWCSAGTLIDGWVADIAQFRVNVDVSWQSPWLNMLVNDPTSHTISRYIGTNGVDWFTHPQDLNPIINGGSNYFTTPHAEIVDWNNYKIYFGFSNTDNSHFESIHAWQFKTF